MQNYSVLLDHLLVPRVSLSLFLFTAIAGGIYALLIIILYKSKNSTVF